MKLSIIRLFFTTLISILFTIIPMSMNAQANEVESNRKLVTGAFGRWTAGTGNVFELLTDDMTWEITGSTQLSKTYKGKASLMDEVINPLNKRLAKKIVPTVRFVFADKDWVIVLWDGKATATDGQPYNMSYAWFMQLKKGKIYNVIAFLDGLKFDDIMKRVTAS